MAWPRNPRPAKSLVKLLEQINEAYPNRSKISDGLLGDAAHRQRGSLSDHNPWIRDAAGVGVVTGADITHDPVHGVHGLALAESLTDDPRTKYVIFAGRMWKARTGRWENYRGSNAHKQHVHISVKQELADDDSEWDLNSVSRPVLKRDSEGQDVRLLQERLHIPITGIFDLDTEHAVREFQAESKLVVDGKVGKLTWRALELK